MAFHPKGNYVLMLALQIMKDDHLEFFIKELMPYVADLAVCQLGICIVNKVIALAQNQDHIK